MPVSSGVCGHCLSSYMFVDANLWALAKCPQDWICRHICLSGSLLTVYSQSPVFFILILVFIFVFILALDILIVTAVIIVIASAFLIVVT